MRLAIKGAMLATAGLFAVAAPISVQAAEFEVGPGGVHVDQGHRWDRRYDRSDCRTIIEHHTNRYGEDVTVRRRVCG